MSWKELLGAKISKQGGESRRPGSQHWPQGAGRDVVIISLGAGAARISLGQGQKEVTMSPPCPQLQVTANLRGSSTSTSLVLPVCSLLAPPLRLTIGNLELGNCLVLLPVVEGVGGEDP